MQAAWRRASPGLGGCDPTILCYENSGPERTFDGVAPSYDAHRDGYGMPPPPRRRAVGASAAGGARSLKAAARWWRVAGNRPYGAEFP
jgi:hypothetical protein